MRELLRQRLAAFQELVNEQRWHLRELPPIEGATKRTQHFLITNGKHQAKISFSPQGGIYLEEPGEDDFNVVLLEWIRKMQPRAWISPEAKRRELAWLERQASGVEE
jgi:hypothetical protein